MNRIVRRPERRRACSASAMTSRISLMPDSTALNAMKCARVVAAITRASVVLPVPGGPHRMIDRRRSCSIASRSGRPGASSASWPTKSSRVRGRMRSASGASRSVGGVAGGSSANRSIRVPRVPLSRRLVENQRRRDGDVERFDRSSHRNGHELVRRHRRRSATPAPSPPRTIAVGWRESRRAAAACRRAAPRRRAGRRVRPSRHGSRRPACRASRPADGTCRPSRRAAPSSRMDSRILRSRRRPSRRKAAAVAHDRADVARDPAGRPAPARADWGLTPMARLVPRIAEMQPRSWTVRTRDGDDAGRVLDGADRGEHLIGDGEDAPAALLDVRGERALSARCVGRELRSEHATMSIGMPQRERFLHQVLAVEQDLTGQRALAGCARELAEALDDRVLPAADPLHPLLLFSIPFLLPWPS